MDTLTPYRRPPFCPHADCDSRNASNHMALHQEGLLPAQAPSPPGPEVPVFTLWAWIQFLHLLHPLLAASPRPSGPRLPPPRGLLRIPPDRPRVRRLALDDPSTQRSPRPTLSLVPGGDEAPSLPHGAPRPRRFQDLRAQPVLAHGPEPGRGTEPLRLRVQRGRAPAKRHHAACSGREAHGPGEEVRTARSSGDSEACGGAAPTGGSARWRRRPAKRRASGVSQGPQDGFGTETSNTNRRARSARGRPRTRSFR